MEKNIAEQMVDMLVDAGIKRIYAVTGDSLNHLNDAVRKNGKIKYMSAMKKLVLMLPQQKLSWTD